MADIVIINPRFEISFWGMEHCMPMFGKRANLPVACLPLLAALDPGTSIRSRWSTRTSKPIDFDGSARADIVVRDRHERPSGANARDPRGAQAARRVHGVVGGPMATSSGRYLDELADVIFVGEARRPGRSSSQEWKRGRHKRRYEQAEKTDMTHAAAAALRPAQDAALPVRQRADLARLSVHSASSATSSSRSAAGRGSKTSAQVSPSSTRSREPGIKIVFIVDDNLIGNKKAIKPMLRDDRQVAASARLIRSRSSPRRRSTSPRTTS